MEIIPLKNYVLLKEVTEDSSVVIPDSMDSEGSDVCVVVEKGSEVNLEKGEKVLILPHMFKEVKSGEEKFLIGKEENIIARIS